MGIKVAIVGVGNCASSLVQGVAHYSNGGANEAIGLIHWDMAGYRPRDINIVAAWAVDRRKVGKDVSAAIFTRPRSEEHTSELQSLMRNSYAILCWNNNKTTRTRIADTLTND